MCIMCAQQYVIHCKEKDIFDPQLAGGIDPQTFSPRGCQIDATNITPDNIDEIFLNKIEDTKIRINQYANINERKTITSFNEILLIVTNFPQGFIWKHTILSSTIKNIHVRTQNKYMVSGEFNTVILDHFYEQKYYVVFVFDDKIDFIHFLDDFIQNTTHVTINNDEINICSFSQKQLCDYNWNTINVCLYMGQQNIKNQDEIKNINFLWIIGSINAEIFRNSSVTKLRSYVNKEVSSLDAINIFRTCKNLIDLCIGFESFEDNMYKALCSLPLEKLAIQTLVECLNFNDIIEEAFIKNTTIKKLSFSLVSKKYTLDKKSLDFLSSIKNVSIKIKTILSIPYDILSDVITIINTNNIKLVFYQVMITSIKELSVDCKEFQNYADQFYSYILLKPFLINEFKNWQNYNKIINKDSSNYYKKRVSLFKLHKIR